MGGICTGPFRRHNIDYIGASDKEMPTARQRHNIEWHLRHDIGEIG
jgi:hypothetical protein